MEVLVLDGKNYVKASKAAKDLGYATDYVGQLCRSGQVDAHLIGRTWYVDQEMLGTHKTEKKRMSRIKARVHAKRSIEEYRLEVNKTKDASAHVHIQYESDDGELIPKTKKLVVESIGVPKGSNFTEDEVSDDREVINEGDRVIMSGELDVVDVTEGEEGEESIRLTPGRILKTPPRAEKSAVTVPKNSSSTKISIVTEDDEFHPKINKKISFVDRLAQEKPESEALVEGTPIMQKTKHTQSIVRYVLTVLVILILALASLFVTRVIVYSTLSISKTVEYFDITLNQEELSSIVEKILIESKRISS